MLVTSPEFRRNAAQAMQDAGLQKALARTRPHFPARRAAAVAALPEFEALREEGRRIKDHTLAHLDFYLEAFAERVERAGGQVHWCEDAAAARARAGSQLSTHRRGATQETSSPTRPLSP
jgi:L-lactate dehydrogenase complex protein LldF